MSKEEWKKALLDGVSAYFNFKKKKATINLHNYLDNPAAIGAWWSRRRMYKVNRRYW